MTNGITTDKAVAVPIAESSADLRAVFPDIVASLFSRTVKEHLFERTFPGTPVGNRFWAFCNCVGHPNARLVIGRAKNAIGEIDTAGYGFLYQSNGSGREMNAVMGLVFFREWWGKAEIMEMSEQTVNYWFSLGYRVLFASILKRNRLAERFTRLAGFQKGGEMPAYFAINGFLEDAVMYHRRREGE